MPLDLRKLRPLIIHGSTKQIQLSILTTIWYILKTDNIAVLAFTGCVIMELIVCKRKGTPPRYPFEVPSFWHLNLGYRSGWKLDTPRLTLFEYLFSPSLECQYHVPLQWRTCSSSKFGLYLVLYSCNFWIPYIWILQNACQTPLHYQLPITIALHYLSPHFKTTQKERNL